MSTHRTTREAIVITCCIVAFLAMAGTTAITTLRLEDMRILAGALLLVAVNNVLFAVVFHCVGQPSRDAPTRDPAK